MIKKRKKYTMSKAARNQRRLAPMKPNACHDWKTAKVETRYIDLAKEHYGSVNRALQFLFGK